MKKNVKLISALGVAVVIVAVLFTSIIKTAGGTIDVVGKDSATAFDAVLTASGDSVERDEAQKGWALNAPDGTAAFNLSENFSESPLFDVMLSLDVTPFEKAGLDVTKLPENYAAQDGRLLVGAKLGDGAEQSTPKEAYEQIVKSYPKAIGYHASLDHYNVSLGDGNMFEWAKDMEINGATKEAQDKDIVFVLNPEPLIAAGVDPAQLDGWVYTTVKVGMGASEKEVYKFLKPFNLQ